MQINEHTIFQRGIMPREYHDQIRAAQLALLWPMAQRINEGKSTLKEEAKREDLNVATLRQRFIAAGIERKFSLPEANREVAV